MVWDFVTSCGCVTQSTNVARCLAHIINLATQAIISTHSKSKFCSGNLEDDQLPDDVGALECDEIGILCAICVKVCFNLLLYVCISNVKE
jgi:hypothetical protein